jgi:voltage-gated potassium channel
MLARRVAPLARRLLRVNTSRAQRWQEQRGRGRLAPRRHVRANDEPNFLYLFSGLLALLVGAPIVNAMLGRPTVLVGLAMHSLLLLTGVWTLAGSRRLFAVGILLSLASVGTTALATVRTTPSVSLASGAIAWTFCLLTAVLCVRCMFARARVTANHLLGATCVYLLLGVLWGLAYGMLHLLRTDSFRAADPGDAIQIDDLMYFSFVTLTTTGFGDIVPVDRLVRTLVYLEGVAGQLYVAILVATLVSQYVAPVREPPSP